MPASAVASTNPTEPNVLRREDTLRARLCAKGPGNRFLGGLIAEEVSTADGKKTTVVHITNPWAESPTIASFESPLSAAEVEQIRREILPIPEAYEILHFLANCYRFHLPAIIESETSIGKSFLIDKFTELLHGRGIKPVDYYCSKQTESSDLFGAWIPRGEDSALAQRWAEFAKSPFGREKIQAAYREVAGALGAGKLTLPQAASAMHAQMEEIADDSGIFNNLTDYVFQPGPIPQAMAGERSADGRMVLKEGGSGHLCHIQEIGLARGEAINGLLGLRGDHGQLAKAIDLPEAKGERVQAGPKFFLAMSSNLTDSGGYLDRTEIDGALASGLRPLKIRSGLSKESFRIAAEHYFQYRLFPVPENPPGAFINISKFPELGKQIGEVVAAFHNEFVQIVKTPESGRRQRIPVTLRDMARLARFVAQVHASDPSTGDFDMVQTLKTGVETIYIARLASDAHKRLARQSLETLLNEPTTGSAEFRGRLELRSAILTTLGNEAVDASPAAEIERATRRARAVSQKLSEKHEDGDPANLAAIERTAQGTIVHFGNPFDPKRPAIAIRSYATPEQVQETLKQIFVLPEAAEILWSLACAQAIKTPLVLEGDASLGKSYLIKKFSEIIHGPRALPVEIYCKESTDASAFVGKWVPRADDGALQREWQAILQALVVESRSPTPELKRQLEELVVRSGLRVKKSDYEFAHGAIAEAQTAQYDTKGARRMVPSARGTLLSVEEVGAARPGVVNQLLLLGGSHGQVSSSFQVHQHLGETMLSGESFNLAMPTNPPELKGFVARREVDPALASRSLWVRLAKMQPSSIEKSARHYLGMDFDLPKVPGAIEPINIREQPQLLKALAEVCAEFHLKVSERAQQLGRIQRGVRPITLRDLGALSAIVSEQQVRDSRTGLIDFKATILQAAGTVYLGWFADADRKELKDNLAQILEEPSKHAAKLIGTSATRAQLLSLLSQRAEPVTAASARVAAAVGSHEGAEQQAATFDLEDAHESVLKNPNIPDHIKELLRRRSRSN